MKRPRSFPSVMIQLVEISTPVSSWMLLLQSGVKTTTVVIRFKNHHVLYGMVIYAVKAV